jgi:hypothetical protein
VSIRKTNITFSNTGQTFELNKASLGNITSLLLTTSDFTLSVSDLQDEDTMFNYMLNGDVFPLHNVFDVVTQTKQIVYTDSLLDNSFRSYRGKDAFTAKYNIRPDYRQLISQFNGHDKDLRLILCFNNEYYLTTQTGSNQRGFKISDINIEDIEILNDFNTPLRIELADKSERDSEVLTNSGYKINNIDRRILSIQTEATADIISLNIEYLGNGITGIVADEITVEDQQYGELTFTTFVPGAGIYQLSDFKFGVSSVSLTGGCISIQTEGYIGRQKYTVEIVITYANFNLLSDDNFTLLSGDNIILINSV